VLNDQRPQVLPSGQNIHVRFACLYHTMIHSGKKVPFLSVFSRLKAQQTQKTLKGIKPIKVFLLPTINLLFLLYVTLEIISGLN